MPTPSIISISIIHILCNSDYYLSAEELTDIIGLDAKAEVEALAAANLIQPYCKGSEHYGVLPLPEVRETWDWDYLAAIREVAKRTSTPLSFYWTKDGSHIEDCLCDDCRRCSYCEQEGLHA